MAADSLGTLSVNITGDYSELVQAIQDATEAATAGAEQIGKLGESIVAIGEALAITEGLKEFGQEALTAAGTVQSVSIGLEQLTGSAEEAGTVIEDIKNLAATEPFAFPEIAPTIQKMVALGVSAEQIPGVMQAVADAAAATGNSFQAVANSFDRMTLSGTINARALVQLGISTTQLGEAMGVSADDVKAAFAAMDQEDRINALEAALGKFAGAAEAQAQGIAGQWQIFQNQFEEVMVAVGDAIAPVVTEILKFGESVLTEVQSAIEWFNKLPAPARDTAVAVGLAVAALAPLAAGLGAVAVGIGALSGLLPALIEGLTTLGIVSGEAAAAETAAAVATEAVAASTVTAAEATEAAAAATTGIVGTFAAISAGAVALLTGLVADLAAAGTGIVAFVAGLGTAITEGGSALLAFATVDVAAVAAAASSLAAGALTALGAALSVVGVGAVLAAAAFAAWKLGEWADQNIPGLASLDEHIASILMKIPGMNILFGISASQLATVGVSSQALARYTAALESALAEAGVTIDKGSMSAAQYAEALKQAAAAHGVLVTALQGTDPAVKTFVDNVKAVADQLAANKQALADAKATLDFYKAANDGSATAVAELALAQANYDKVLTSSTPHAKNWADTLAGVTAAAAQSVEKEQSLAQALVQAQAGFDAGTVSTGLFIDVYNKAQSAAKAMGDTLIDVQAEEVKLNQASVNAQVTYGAEKQIFSDLMLKYEAGIIDLTELEAGYKNLQKAADAAGTSAYNQAAAMLAAVDAAGKQDTALKDNITTLGGLATASIQTTEVTQAAADVFKQVASEASAMGVQITNVGGVYQITAKNITPAIQAIIDQTTKWMTQNGLTVSNVASGMTVVKDATTGILSYSPAVDKATDSVTKLGAAHTAATSAAQGHSNAITAATNAAQHYYQTEQIAGSTIITFTNSTYSATDAVERYYTVTQSGDSTIITFTNDANDQADALNNVADAADAATQALDGFNEASSETSGVSGGGSSGGPGDVASFMKMVGATGDMITAFMGASGYVTQGGTGYGPNQNYESVSDYNDSITALAAKLNDSVITSLDQFGNTLDALGPPLQSSTTATKAAASATTSASSAVTDLAAAADPAATTITGLATTTAAAAATLATATTAAATTISQATTAVSNAAVAAASTALAVAQAASGATAQSGEIINSAGLNVGSLTLGPSAAGGNALVATITPGTGQSTPFNNSQPLQLVVNLNGGMVVGQNGMTQLTQMIMPQVTTLLRQAGAKV